MSVYGEKFKFVTNYMYLPLVLVKSLWIYEFWRYFHISQILDSLKINDTG